MGLKPRSKLDGALAKYLRVRARANEIWENLYEQAPNPSPATDAAIAALKQKLGRPLPADYERFLRMHDGWEDYEYDRHLLTAQEIVDDAGAESVEINIDNISEDEADELAKMFVIGVCNSDATVLYFDPTVAGEMPLVEYYCEEVERYPSFTAFLDSLTESLDTSITRELETQKNAGADWDPSVRADKEATYYGALAARLDAAPPPVFGLTADEAAAIAACANAVADQPAQPAELNADGLNVYASVLAYMLYMPTAGEVSTAAQLFRKHFPWDERTIGCAASDEYALNVIPAGTSDYTPFLKMQTAGHFGLRMVDDNGSLEHVSVFDDTPDVSRIFNFRGAPEYHGEQIAAFLEILVPPDSDPAALRALVLDLADALPLHHGLAGYAALPKNSDYVSHMAQLYQWCRAHWGLQMALADELVNPALFGLHGVSWLTLIDNATMRLVEQARRPLPKTTRIHRRGHMTVLETGDAPSLGDIRVAYPQAYADLHRSLAPLMTPRVSELRHFDNDGGTQAWWHRFERPIDFARSPGDVFEQIEAAAQAGDPDAMRAAWKSLAAREPAARDSLQEKLSRLGAPLINNDNAVAVVIYDWLTQLSTPWLNDLNNAICAAWDQPAFAPLALERALPRAADNPYIFHNAIGLCVQHGDLDRAVQIARDSVPHYKAELFPKLKSDPDFAPLFERDDFLAVYDQLKARLQPASDWPPLARNPELEAAVGASDDDEAPYRAYAAWLTEQDDPRGELILAGIETEADPRAKPARSKHRKLVKQYIAKRLRAEFPVLGEQLTADLFHWGLVDNFDIGYMPAAVHPEGLRFLQHPEAHLVRRVSFKGMDLDLTILEHIPYLRRLTLTQATFPSLEPVAKLEHLDELVLTQTDVDDISVLATMPRLRKLYLKATRVSDLAPISKLPNLEFISLEHAPVTDIQPLLELPRLCEVWLYNTDVPKPQSEQLKSAINARDTEPGRGVKRMVYGP